MLLAGWFSSWQPCRASGSTTLPTRDLPCLCDSGFVLSALQDPSDRGSGRTRPALPPHAPRRAAGAGVDVTRRLAWRSCQPLMTLSLSLAVEHPDKMANDQGTEPSICRRLGAAPGRGAALFAGADAGAVIHLVDEVLLG